MDFRGRRHERGSNWTDPEIVELLQLWSDDSIQIELESSLRNQRVFDRIAFILREKGVFRTGDQCREKIKKMKLEYRRIKDNHKMRSWKFYDVMDRVLANRPAITYSSLGGAVVAQQLFQGPAGPEAYLQGVPTGTFGPVSSGGFLFGQPPKMESPLDIKCEEDERSMLDTGDAPPEMYYASGDEQETDGQSVLGPEDSLGQGESSTNARISSSGLSDVTPDAPAAASSLTVDDPAPLDTPEQPNEKASHTPAAMRQKKRRRGGRSSWSHGRACCGGHGGLEKALTSFINWQKTAEERLLNLEESHLERELQAEERREKREQRRAEQEREHELRLFTMLTGAMFSAGRTTPSTVTTQTGPSVPPQAPTTASLATAPVVSGSSSQPSSDTVSTQQTRTSSPQTPSKSCQMSQNASGAPCRSVYLSNRGNRIRQHQGILQEGFLLYAADRHDDRDNPHGVINMGTSENKLCYDLLHKRLTKPDMLYVEPSLLQYSDWRGHLFLREAVAKFMTHYCSSPKPLKADNVVVVNGCSSLFSCLAAVICDPTDVVLIPTPFYGVITDDLDLYCDVKLFHVPLDCEVDDKNSCPFHLTVEKLEAGLIKAKQEGLTIRAVVLVNPHNPLAEVYSQEEMTAFLDFAKRNELHAIVDEVYMLTVFDESLASPSVLSLHSLPDPQRTHVMWGMSKDFAMAGFRIGTLYTENTDIVEALAQLGSLHGIAGTTQHQAAQLLQDKEWISEEFLPENRRRLKAAHRFLTGELQSMDIPYIDRPTGLFVWADFRKYLRESSFEEELSLWRRFLTHKVVVSCGQAFHCSTPGWFRVVFADQQSHIQLGLNRLKNTLKEIDEISKSPDSHSAKEFIEERRKTTAKEHSADPDNAATVNSTSSPQSTSWEQPKEKDGPVPDTGLSPPEEFVVLDCQASNNAESLESLIGTLKQQIRSTDWLERKTPELSPGEDPEILDVFQALLQRARK